MTEASRRCAALLVVAALLASGPLLPGRGCDRPVALPPPAASPFSLGGIVLTRVYPNAARDDEFVELANLGSEDVAVGNWSLTDLEDAALFPENAVLPAGARIVATRNGTAYEEDVLRMADYTWDRGAGIRLGGGVLRLADGGDEVLLMDASGTVVDAFVYGASTYAGSGWTGPPARAPGRGEVAVRGAGGPVTDVDSKEDWDGLRAFRLGQAAFLPTAVEVDGAAVPVVSPDDGAAPVLAFLGSGASSIQVAVYTLTSQAIASVLADRARHGVRVRVLLESAPVGGLEASESRLVAALVGAGADVRWLTSADDVVKRYRYLHAKYAIVDGDGVLVSSENFGEAGFPTGDDPGNRGWSLIVRDPELARQLRDVFDEDFDPRRRDTVPAIADGAGALPSAAVPPWSWPAPSSLRRARLVIGPDNALADDAVLGVLAAARLRLWIDAFYIEEAWGTASDPYLEAAFEAARRGVDVRILMDRGFPTEDGSAEGNEAVAERINARARAERLPLEVRLLEPWGHVERVHNKGLVADGRTVVVSSINWALGSATENREIGLVLEDAAAASVFERAFLDDWDGPSGFPSFPPTDPLALLGVYAAVGGASALSLRFLRRGDKGLKPGGRMELRGLLRAHLRGGHREVRVLSPQLVAEPRPRAGGGDGDRGGGEEARDRLGGPEGD